eukprot:232520-Amphidinium_carterae.1
MDLCMKSTLRKDFGKSLTCTLSRWYQSKSRTLSFLSFLPKATHTSIWVFIVVLELVESPEISEHRHCRQQPATKCHYCSTLVRCQKPMSDIGGSTSAEVNNHIQSQRQQVALKARRAFFAPGECNNTMPLIDFRMSVCLGPCSVPD